MKNTLQRLFEKQKNKYVRKIIEELNELACAVSHYVDGKIESEELIEEISDVYLQLIKLQMSLVSFNLELHEVLQKRINGKVEAKYKNLELML